MRLMLRLTLENIRLVFSSHLVLYALVLFHKDDMAETKKRILTRGKNLFLGESHVVLMPTLHTPTLQLEASLA